LTNQKHIAVFRQSQDSNRSMVLHNLAGRFFAGYGFHLINAHI
jgi:hypothetical protein